MLPRRPLIALLAVLALGIAACGAGPVTFTHGVASGDVRPDGAVLWTRIDKGATLSVEVATDRDFTDIALKQEVKAEKERDFTVKAEVSGLEPGATYYYRFRRGDDMSEVGAFNTAPAEDEAATVRFIFSGDSDGTVREDGTRAFDFRVLQAAQAENADFFLYFGDTIYADSPFGAKAETLDEYRAKYKENRDIDFLRQILASTSIYTVWDDHEVENDFAGTTVDPELFAAGLQAFREYMPLSGDDTPGVLYRRFRWGQAVEIIILDQRSFRDEDATAACTPEGQDDPDLLPSLGAADVPAPYRSFRGAVGLPGETDPACLEALHDPNRTFLGQAQKEFLFKALEESEATFKFIVNEVAISELVFLPYDRWEGYRAERDEVLRFIQERGISNVVFLTTDIHANIINDVRLDVIADARADPIPPPIAIEAIAGPIAHATLGDDLSEGQDSELAESLGDVDIVAAFNLFFEDVVQVDCVEPDAFSYGLVEVDPVAGTTTITLKDEDGVELCQTVITAA